LLQPTGDLPLVNQGLTIDALAARAGTTTRNVRAYQSRGLVPPPTLVGRVGYYGEEHLARLRLIAALQQRGYSLASIAGLLQGWERGQSIGDLLGFEEALAGSWLAEPPHFVTVDELREAFGEAPEALERAQQVGLLRQVEGGYEADNSILLDVASQLVASGVPLEEVIEEAGKLKKDANRIAKRFLTLFLRNIWEPYVAAGKPASELPRITEILRRLRPLAGTTSLAFLHRALGEQASVAVAEMLEVVNKPEEVRR
jgi:DNA-binding transcriptional MerR regulator